MADKSVRKLIDLPESTVGVLNILAMQKGISIKKYIEWVLNTHSEALSEIKLRQLVSDKQ